ncbi:MAG: general secretion pathway protein GspB [Gammaproteobacteria bacterium]|nr:general secretion pathway protein GspB [Gammaproteobacteria bacterium]MBV8308326.1 general secretion pathway protein GspB [Gammaproteobacteria bacterium]MBV8405769.1 general secretion pathway protein GspB [Gammaproteobacteria bacterium]
MSFILDALKKSESDRQRQSGPALFEVRVAPPRTRLPPWAIAIALLLALNFGIAIWMLRHQGHASATAAGDTSASTAPAGAGSAAAGASGTALPAAAPSVPVVATSAPAATAPAAAAAPPAVSAIPAAPPVAAPGPAGAAPAAAVAATAAATGAEPASPEDYAPAAEQPATAGIGSHVRRGTESGVPLYQDVSTTAGTQVPQLRLDLHVFAAKPQDRFVMINMHKLREGDTLPEGVHVDSITPEGAILSYNGSKFLLPRD